ncbi:MAG: hypothetical protein ACFFFH_05205 [Candidatus Thorarchaeota archaeon]
MIWKKKPKWIVENTRSDGSKFQLIIKKKILGAYIVNGGKLEGESAGEIIIPLNNEKLIEVDLSQLSNIYEIKLKNSPTGKIQYLKLKLNNNNLENIDLSSLENWSDFTVTVDLSNNFLRKINLEPLSYCKGLRELNLKDNRLENIDLTPLQHCKNLCQIDLRKNALSRVDISPLINCFSNCVPQYSPSIDIENHVEVIIGSKSHKTGEWLIIHEDAERVKHKETGNNSSFILNLYSCLINELSADAHDEKAKLEFSQRLGVLQTIPNGILEFLEQSIDMSNRSPEASIIRAFKSLEELLYFTYERKYGKPLSPIKPSEMQKVLNNIGVTPDNIDIWIGTIRILRNRCLHRESQKTPIQVTISDSNLVIEIVLRIFEYWDNNVNVKQKRS